MPGHSLLELGLGILFLLSVILIWFMIAYQLVLTLAGFFHYRLSRKEQVDVDAQQFDFPKVTILIPARNEEKVIGRTLQSMVNLDYPSTQLSIIVIDDGSTDATQSIIRNFIEKDPRVKLFVIPSEESGQGKSRALNLGL